MLLVTSNQIRDALNKDGNGTFDFRDVKNPPSSYPRQADDVMFCHFAFAGKVIAYKLTYYILSSQQMKYYGPLKGLV